MIRITIPVLYFICIAPIFFQVKENTLPVELMYFYATQDGSCVYLNWGTATETNNYGYDIERSDFSKDFEVIGFVPGHGNSFSPKYYYFTDSTLSDTGIYHYRLKQIDTDGAIEYSDTVQISFSRITSVDTEVLNKDFTLYQNYPNPFNPETNIQYNLPKQGFVKLVIYDTRGRELFTLLAEYQNAGFHIAGFTINHLPSGFYFYKLTLEFNGVIKYSDTKKLLLLK